MRFKNAERSENNVFRRNKKLWRRVLSFIIVFSLVFNSMYLDGLFRLFDFSAIMTVKAEGETPSYTATNLLSEFSGNNFTFPDTVEGYKKFVDYCYYYSVNEGGTFCNDHKADTLSINFFELPPGNDGSFYGFMGLGNASVPFAGKVTFIASAGVSNLSLPRALFTHVSTDARLTDNDNIDITLEISKISNVSSPLFADYVHPGDGDANWKIKAVPDANSYDFAGVIGQIETGASVTLEFENSSSNAVSNTASGGTDIKDVGEICGIMKTGSSLTVTDSTTTRPAVSSANGNAGSLVGKMEGTASLTLNSGYPSFSSVSVTAGNGYAGGLVGDMASSATITFNGLSDSLAVGGSVTGKNGAGGLYGHYTNSASTFDLKDYNITAVVSGDFCGGVFGVLDNNKGEAENAFSLTIKNTGNAGTVNVGSGNSASGGYYGGLVGKYSTDDLTNSLMFDNLTITSKANASFSSFGGVIGYVDGAAYIYADDMSVTATGTALGNSEGYFGGLVGKTSDTRGVFLDLGDFTLTVNDSDGLTGGGIVGNFMNGVIRLSGVTDMSSAQSKKGGQLVGKNNNVLVYAIGDGTNGDSSIRDGSNVITQKASGWSFKRSSTASKVDDLGTWGEVVRIADIEDSTNGVLTPDFTNHTVTIKAAQTSLGTQKDLVKTALNIQLNQGSNYDCLKFTSGNNTRAYLLGTTLTLTDDLSFANTGITGFMRDGSDSIGVFTGTLNGDSHVITLAVGQAYGLTGSGSAVSSSNEGVGQIYSHKQNGLFAVLGNPTANSSATVSNLKVAGTINVNNKVDGMNIGSVAASNGGNVSLSGVTVGDSTNTMTINYKEIINVGSSDNTGKNIGGLIGFVGTNGIVDIQGKSSVGASINISGSHTNYNNSGGAIGNVTASAFSINAGKVGDANNKLTVKVNVSVSNVTDVGEDSNSGGLIGRIKNAESYSTRTVNVNNVDFNSCILANASSKNGGGVLGYSWLNTTANIKGLTVSSATINNHTTNGEGGGNANIGAMCYESTGKWVVDSLTVTSLSMPKGGGESFGMLVNKAYTYGTNSYTGGLYLDVLNSGYTLTAATLTEVTGKYDEIAAYTAKDDADILTGGAGVVSINMNTPRAGAVVSNVNVPNVRIADYTANSVTTTGTSTYSNKLSSFSSKINNTSRYYYNLDLMSSSDNAQNIMLWSVKKYAYTDIKGEFNTSIESTLNGTADMTGLSFYPVALADGITISNLTLKLDYAGIYAKTGVTMDPAASNQHYLMHSGLFLNSSAGSTLTISGTLSLNGNFLEVGKYNGVLISDTMKGTLTCTNGSIVLNGITPKSTGGANYKNGYLLVNNINRVDNTVAIPELKLFNVSTGTGYTAGTTVAKSLIGPAVGPGLKMTFSKIKFDATTSNSIFSESTLVNSIKTNQDAQLIYNFTWDDDWGDANNDDSADRNVTYGKELSDRTHSGSMEYADKETKYSSGTGTEKHRWYVNPTNNTSLSSAVDFSGYRPYVYQPFTSNTPDSDGYFYREIMVNVEAEGLTVGCGTYNDSYQISTSAQLKSVAEFLQNNTLATTLGNVNLPKTKPSSFTSGARWCEDNHGEYQASNTSFIKPEGGADWSRDDVQKYLANAYYKVTTDITLDDFVGLGGTTANTAFRGVIVGSGTDNNGVPAVTITNETDKPFINVSNGSVIKDINFVVKSDVSLTLDNVYNSTAKKYYVFGYGDGLSGYTSPYYGGIIGEIMSGDNIIDNSYVSYKYKDDNNVYHTSVITLNGTNGGTSIPVGGYVGVVVFGGLIFKNMTVTDTVGEDTVLRANNSHLTVNYTGKTYNLADNSDDEAWAAIYVNPIVGRVINGYAVNETTQFSVTENKEYHDDGKTQRIGIQHSLKNGAKHYSIADINKNESQKLEVASIAGNSDGIIKIPNAQAFFVLSLITQSCAGTAQSATGDYKNSLSYGTYNNNVYGMSHIASYSYVGNVPDNTSSSSIADYNDLASKDTAGNTTASDYAIPYIIYHYTKADSSTYPARCVTSTSGYYNIYLTGKTANSKNKDANNQVIPLNSYTYQLPDSFRGLGCVGFFDYNTTVKNNYFSIKLNVFDGDDCSIDEDIFLNRFQTDNYFSTLHKGTNQLLNDSTAYTANPSSNKNKETPNNHGIGLFDSVIMKDSHSVFRKFTLSGSVRTAVFSNSYLKNAQEIHDSNVNLFWLSTGGVCGWETINIPCAFENIILKDFSASGSCFVGGLLGFSALHSTDLIVKIKQCSAEDVSVKMTTGANNDTGKDNENQSRKWRNAIGTFVGKVHEAGVVIYGTSAEEDNTNLTDYSTVKIKSFSFSKKNNNQEFEYYTAAGGLVGFAGNGCKAYDMKVISSNDTVTLGGDKIGFSGGMVGGMQSTNENETTCLAYFKNCTVENLDIRGKFSGGFYGGKWLSNWTPYTITLDNCKMIGQASKNTIYGEYHAGGLVGRGLVYTGAEGVANITITDCSVTNYNILASKGYYSGGFIGYCATNKAGSSITCYIHDSFIENCEIGLGGTTNNGDYAGGIIGGIAKLNANKILGYNIKLDNVSSPNENRKGTWIGYVDTNDGNTSIQFSGMAVYGEDYNFTQNVGNRSNFSNASFVFADYTGASKNYITTTTTSSSVAKQAGDEDSKTETFTVNSTTKTVTRVITTVTVGDTETTTETQTTVYPYISSSTADPVTDQSITDNSSVWAVHENAGTITYTVSNATEHTSTVTTYNLAVSNYNSTNNVVMPKYPYVNVNPQSDMGTDEIISGDGAVLASSASNTAAYSEKTAKSTMALKIYEDMYLTDTNAANYSRRYTTFKSYNDADTGKIYNNNKIDYYMKRTVDDDGDRISTYQDEKGELPSGVENFAVVVIANNKADETTALINRYIQLVTNTSTDYTEYSPYYNMVVSSCHYSTENGFEIKDTAAGLTWTPPVTSTTNGVTTTTTKGSFALNPSGADSLSSDDSFTLVDVQFKDPFNTNKIAYHLYVPVYTIKEIEVSFSAAVMNGTNSASYSAGVVDNPYGAKLAITGADTHVDNLNTWFTTYIRYTYSYGDIQALLNSGNLNWNHKKSFYIDKYGNNAVSMLPENTYMILVDPNGDHDKKYQVTLNNTDFKRVNNRITFDFTKFEDSSDHAFNENTFNELIAKKLTATTNSSHNGKYDYVGGTPSNTGDTHYVYIKSSDGTPTYYAYVGSDGEYDITLPNEDIYEDYYISMYVPGTANDTHLYGYYIRTPETFGAPSYESGTNNAKPKSAKINCVYVGNNYTNTTTINRQVYIGNVFEQSTTLTVRPNDPEIDGDNHTLNIYATTTITPRDNNVYAILKGINPDIYHSFNVFLDKKDEYSVTTNEIAGLIHDLRDSENIDTDIHAWYSIGTPIPMNENAEMDGFNSIDAENIELEANYINVTTGNCGSAIFGSNSITIYSRIELDFRYYEREFPQKVTSDTGVSVRAASNLAYEESSLAFSNVSKPMEEPTSSKHIYYRQSFSTASMNYYAEPELDCYDTDGSPSENYSRLGVSGRYSMNNYMPIDTTARYNVQNIESAWGDAEYLDITLSLQKKTDDPNGGPLPYTSASYQNVSSINAYWGAVVRDSSNKVDPDDDGKPVTDTGKTNLHIKCGSYDQIVPVNPNTVTFSLSIPKEDLDNSISGFQIDGYGYIYIHVGFNAKTGDGFTEYANYKVNITAKLRGDTGDITGSYADDYLIYTNAKINHDFLRND